MPPIIAFAVIPFAVVIAWMFIDAKSMEADWKSSLSRVRRSTDAKRITLSPPPIWQSSTTTTYEPDVEIHSFRGSRFSSAKHSPWRRRMRNVGALNV
jgi:hypothetical protein